MVAMVTRIKYFETFPSSYIEVTPYFYFLILKRSWVDTPSLIIKSSRAEVNFTFIFMSNVKDSQKCCYFLDDPQSSPIKVIT